MSRSTVAGITSSLPTWSDDCGSWWERRVEADHRISVFAVFNWSRFDRIQLATSSTQLVIVFWSSCDADGRQDPYIWVSSAYKCGKRPWLWISGIRSVVYSRNRIGTNPCGRPTLHTISQLSQPVNKMDDGCHYQTSAAAGCIACIGAYSS